MKRTSYLFLALFVGIVIAGTAWGQTLRQPNSLRPAVSDYSYYLEDDEPSPSDVPRPSQPLVTADGCGVAGCSDCGGSCGGRCRTWGVYDFFPNSDCCEKWRLFPELPYCFTLQGWVDAGATANEWSTPSRYNGPLAFNDRRELQMNQLYLVLDRPVQMDGYGWDWGARVDLMYGTDYIFNQQLGWETRTNGAPKWNGYTLYGLAMPQAYVEVARNQLSLKLGRFYTIMGYENPMAPANFFYSHAYTFVYGEPFTHTGGLFTWRYSDQLDLYGGLVNSWDQFDGQSDRLNVLAGFAYRPCHGAYWFNGSIILGPTHIGGGVYRNTTFYSLVFGLQLTDRLEYVLQHDLGWTRDQLGPGQDAEWYGVNQYLLYSLNECWKFGARFEWFRDDDGVRVAGVRATNPYAGGSAGNFYDLAVGLNWIPSPNVLVRPEIRWDKFDGVGALPFNDGASDHQLSAALDVILHF